MLIDMYYLQFESPAVEYRVSYILSLTWTSNLAAFIQLSKKEELPWPTKGEKERTDITGGGNIKGGRQQCGTRKWTMFIRVVCICRSNVHLLANNTSACSNYKFYSRLFCVVLSTSRRVRQLLAGVNSKQPVPPCFWPKPAGGGTDVWAEEFM